MNLIVFFAEPSINVFSALQHGPGEIRCPTLITNPSNLSIHKTKHLKDQ